MTGDVYQRRYERERAARAEAERIAEGATRALYQALASQQAIVSCAGDAILAADAGGLITLANPAAHAMLGQDELVGQDLHVSIHAASCNDGCEVRRSIDGQASTLDFETQIRAPGGAAFPGSVTVTPIARQGAREGVVLTMRDTTVRRREAETRIRLAAQQEELRRLKEMNGLKTDFMNTAAHELRTPLTPIRTELYLLDRLQDSLDERARKSVQILVRNFERLARLVEDVLDGARIQAGRLGFQFHETDLGAMVHDAVETFRSTAEAKGITLEERLGLDVHAHADPERIAQVLSNLLSNALKFTPAGGTVRVEANRVDGGVTFAVADSGVGIGADDAARLFQPFSQVGEHAKLTRQGAGLGLYICKGIVEMHGGHIWVQSDGPDKGTTFAFKLPLRPSEGAQ